MLIFSILFLFSCENKTAGTLGRGNKYLFSCSAKNLNLCLDNFSKTTKQLKVPNKWKRYDNWKEKGYNFLDGKIFYFKNDDKSIEEMYYVSIIDAYPKNNHESNVAIRAVFRFIENKPRWLYFDDLDEKESEKIEDRFQKLVLNKMTNNLCNCRNYKIITR
ncbi:hypothetical protein AB674_01765 [Flavobacterium sp. ABG]|nr:hypothetical protein AB674_01765 [Flavobacterium sp. ABG]